MRFDLTNASRRVLDRAADLVIPGTPSEISPAKLLLALFEEEECRAADWLAQAGLTAERFRSDFGLEKSVLQSPISAPGFPVGDYGVPPGLYQGVPQVGLPKVEASPADGQAPPVGYPEPQEPPEPELHEEKHPSAPQQEPDDWTAAEPKGGRKTYSPYSQRQADAIGGVAGRARQSQFRFYLDDQPVRVGRLSGELEETLEIILHRFTRSGSPTRKIPGAGNGVVSVIDRKADFFPSFSLATEHLLLAVVLDDGDAGQWLRDHGFEATELYRRIGGDEKNEIEQPELLDAPLDIPPDDREEEETPVVNVTPPTDIEEKLYRLLDAAINRAREAVRVIEDFVRFVLDDEELTRQLKDFRHRFQEISQTFSNRHRLGARNTPNDVGTAIEGRSEYRRVTPHDVLEANFARLQESLRSLEEYSKLIAPELARPYENLRYRCYSLHKRVCLAGQPVTTESGKPNVRDMLEKARLYALIDCRETETDFADKIKAFLEGGVDVIQLRDKTADDRTMLARSELLQTLIAKSNKNVLFVMNDRPDLAILAEADAIHVGQEELSVELVRRIVSPKMLVGVSTHDIEQARRACRDGADYLGAGPVFESATKEFSAFPGLEFLKQVAAEIKTPAFAIGGITLENLERVLETGVRRVAVCSVLLDAEDTRQSVCDFRNRLDKEPGTSVPG